MKHNLLSTLQLKRCEMFLFWHWTFSGEGRAGWGGQTEVPAAQCVTMGQRNGLAQQEQQARGTRGDNWFKATVNGSRSVTAEHRLPHLPPTALWQVTQRGKLDHRVSLRALAALAEDFQSVEVACSCSQAQWLAMAGGRGAADVGASRATDGPREMERLRPGPKWRGVKTEEAARFKLQAQTIPKQLQVFDSFCVRWAKTACWYAGYADLSVQQVSALTGSRSLHLVKT